MNKELKSVDEIVDKKKYLKKSLKLKEERERAIKNGECPPSKDSPADQSQNQNQGVDVLNPTVSKSTPSKSDEQPKSDVKNCPRRNAPCIGKLCSDWVETTNSKYSGCVHSIALPSISLDMKKAAFAMIALAEKNGLKIPFHFGNEKPKK